MLYLMSKIRFFQNLSLFKSFREAVNIVLSAGKYDCFWSSLHVGFDNYIEAWIKSSESIHKCLDKDVLDLIESLEDTQIPQ